MTTKRISEIINQHSRINDTQIQNGSTYSSSKLEALLSQYILTNNNPFLRVDQLIAGYKIQLDHNPITNELTINALIDDSGSTSLPNRLAELISLVGNNLILPGIPTEDPTTDSSKKVQTYLDIIPRDNILLFETLRSLLTIVEDYTPGVPPGNLHIQFIKSLLNSNTRTDLIQYPNLISLTKDQSNDLINIVNTYNVGFALEFGSKFRSFLDILNLITLSDKKITGYDPILNSGVISYFNIVMRSSFLTDILTTLDTDLTADYPFRTCPSGLVKSDFKINETRFNQFIDIITLALITQFGYDPVLKSNINIDHIPELRTDFKEEELISFDYNETGHPINIPYGVDVDTTLDSSTRNVNTLANTISSTVNVETEDVNELLIAPTSFTYRVKTGALPIDIVIQTTQIKVKATKTIFKIISPDDQSITYALLQPDGNIDYTFEHNKVYTISVALSNSYSDNLYGNDYSLLNYSQEQELNVDWYTIYLCKDINNWTTSFNASGPYIGSEARTIDINQNTVRLELAHNANAYVGLHTVISLGSQTMANMAEVQVNFDINFYGANYNTNTYSADGYGLLNSTNYTYSSYNNYINPRNVWLGGIAPNAFSIPATFSNNNWQSVEIYSNFSDSNIIKKDGVTNSFVTNNVDNNYRVFTTSNSATVSLYRSAIRTATHICRFGFGLINYGTRQKIMLIRDFMLKYRPLVY